MKRKHCIPLLLALVLLVSTALPAVAAPSSMQVDFISRMSGKALCVKLGSYLYHVEGDAIYRRTSAGADPKKLFDAVNARDLQIHGSYIYFIEDDSKKETPTLYRFKGTTKSKVLDNVYDAVIGGDTMYYTNSERDTVFSWNLKTDKKRTIYSGHFTGVCEMNYMQNLLTFTATMKGAEKTSLFVYSAKPDHATYYTGSSQGLLAHGSFLYMPDEGGYTRMSFSESKPSISRGKVMLAGVKEAIICGNSFFYWKNDAANGKGRIYKRTISGGTEKLVYEYDLEKYPDVTLEPAGDYMWLFAHDDENGNYYVARLSK